MDEPAMPCVVERGLRYFVVQLVGLGGEGRGGEPAAREGFDVRVLSCVEVF